MDAHTCPEHQVRGHFNRRLQPLAALRRFLPRRETTWVYIQATKTVIETFGLPLRYYVDSLRIFRFVQGRDSFWRKHVLQTDDVDTQWGKMMRLLGVDVIFALSPQAKGKIERPYRWMQDRIVRTCALEKITELGEVRAVLGGEVDRIPIPAIPSWYLRTG